MKPKIKKLSLMLLVLLLLIGFTFPAGEPAEGTTSTTIEAGAEPVNIGNLISEGLNIFASGIQFNKGEGSNILTFLSGGKLKIGDILFENVEKDSKIELNDAGEITFAELTASKDTIFTLDGRDYKVPAGKKIQYNKEESKEGIATIERNIGDVLEFKDSTSDTFTQIKLLSEKIDFRRDSEKNSIITGNFEIGENLIKGLEEGSRGRVSLYKNGMISKVWRGTDATISNIEHKASRDLEIFYDETFDPAAHENVINYVNYGRNSISLGGVEFTTSLKEGNRYFPELDFEKPIEGGDPKKGNFEITPKGGSLEIKRGGVGEEYFDIDSEGAFEIKNGRVLIFSEQDPATREYFIFTSVDPSMGLAYDINFNDGEYTLDNFVLQDKEGNIKFDNNLPWERTTQLATELNTTIGTQTENQKEIYNEELSRTGARPRVHFLQYLNKVTDQDFLKCLFRAVQIANQNYCGVKVTPEEIFTVFMMEGGAAGLDLEGYMDYYYYNDHDSIFEVSNIGLDNIGSEDSKEKLHEGNFIPDDFEINTVERKSGDAENQGQITYSATANGCDALIMLAGEYARRKCVFLKGYENYYEEEATERLTENEIIFGTYYIYNRGEGNLDYLVKNFKSLNRALGEGKDVYGTSRDARVNSKRIEATVSYIRALGLFRFF